MKEMSKLVVATTLLLGVVFAAPNADAQSAKDVVGTYTIVSAMVVQGDKNIEPFGPTPQGSDTGRERPLCARSHAVRAAQIRI